MPARIIIVMGVSGCGKTTIGKLIARGKSLPFTEGDDLHPPDNIEKMRSGIPLNDEDRQDWLAKIKRVIGQHIKENVGCVITCSALRRRYRDFLREGVPDLSFVFLDISYEKVYRQMAARRDHFMPLGLLESQFAALERPQADEKDIAPVLVSGTVEQTTAAALEALGKFND